VVLHLGVDQAPLARGVLDREAAPAALRGVVVAGGLPVGFGRIVASERGAAYVRESGIKWMSGGTNKSDNATVRPSPKFTCPAAFSTLAKLMTAQSALPLQAASHLQAPTTQSPVSEAVRSAEVAGTSYRPGTGHRLLAAAAARRALQPRRSDAVAHMHMRPGASHMIASPGRGNHR
jgi:hypothetical protein